MRSGVKNGEKRGDYHGSEDPVLGSGVVDGEAGIRFDPSYFYRLFDPLVLFMDLFAIFWDCGDATPYVAI